MFYKFFIILFLAEGTNCVAGFNKVKCVITNSEKVSYNYRYFLQEYN